MWCTEHPFLYKIVFLYTAVGFFFFTAPSGAAVGAKESNPAIAKPCAFCHGELTMKYKHPPAVEDCLNCHIEHFDTEYEKYPYNLQDVLNDLCIGCHFDPDDLGGHPVARHPTSGPRDPIHPERRFTCVSCHNPHQSNMPALFRYDYDQFETTVMYPCAICHNRQAKRKQPKTWKDVDPLRANVAAVKEGK